MEERHSYLKKVMHQVEDMTEGFKMAAHLWKHDTLYWQEQKQAEQTEESKVPNEV